MSKEQNTINKLRIAIVCLLLTIVALLVGFAFFYIEEVKDKKVKDKNELKAYPACADQQFNINPHLNDTNGVFHELSEHEILKIETFMMKKVNLSKFSWNSALQMYCRSDDKKTYIMLIDLAHPNKQQVLDYRDNNGTKPARKARVVTIQGMDTVHEYIVWPAHEPTRHEKIIVDKPTKYNLAELHTCNSWIHLKIIIQNKLFTGFTPTPLMQILKETFEDLKNVTNLMDMLNSGFTLKSVASSAAGTEEKYLNLFYTSEPTKATISQFQKYSVLYFVVDVTSTVYKQWNVIKVVYNQKSYSSIDELEKSYQNKTLQIKRFPSLSESARQNEKMHKRESNNRSQLKGPMLFAPNGPRFSINGRQVKYFDWQFEYAVQPLTGPAIFDVRFRKKRIAYEVSLQQFLSTYFGSGPMSGTRFHYFGSGKKASLRRGLDCPDHAIYLDHVSFLVYQINEIQKSLTTKDAICIFEMNSQLPLRRHKTDQSFGGLADHELVVRFLGKLEYSEMDVFYDYVFHQNGAVEVKASLTGFPELDVKLKGTGYEIHTNHNGVPHFDFMLYKVDLDVDGVKNALQTLNAITRLNGQPDKENNLEAQKVSYEMEAAYRVSEIANKYFVIYNPQTKNKHNVNRGYRVQIPSTNQHSKSNNNSYIQYADWTKYQMFVTKQDDDVSTVCSLRHLLRGIPESCSFDRKISNNRSIFNEDLTAWLSVGGLQIPSSEDFPSTTTVGQQYAFILRPFNFFDEDPSMASHDTIYEERISENSWKTFAYGVAVKNTCQLPTR